MPSEPDWKDPPRHKANRREWERLRARKIGPCRVCGKTKRKIKITLHHLVPRSLGGDDFEDNLVPLCGDGTTGCHGLIEAHHPRACASLRRALTVEEVAYISEKRGTYYLRRRYPLTPDD